MEPNEVEELEKEMHEGAESSMKHVSVIISVLAVLVAMVTVMGHRTHTEAVLTQSSANDQWNEYQARKDRIEQDTIAAKALQLQPNVDPAATQAQIDDYQGKVSRWSKEILSDAEKAKDDEADVKVAEARAARFDLAEALLEIAVVMASITLLTKREMFALAAVALGIVGVLIGSSAFLVH
jgi:hypothetical protein